MIQASGGLILLPYNQFVDENGNRVDYYKTYNEDFVTEKKKRWDIKIGSIIIWTNWITKMIPVKSKLSR